ncbi:S-locus protein 7 [Ostreococcus tauri]|uniref:S-locus protein 7 n=1 Tax=Ostreococcus tauri TaxID=70448 RepID=A0A1Y5IQP1_OSTTA|nr:S-locus protein 7 [Ostreococcus tauri]
MDRHADLEWKLTYVGSAEDDEYDQVLDTVLVGPVVRGAYKFVFQANPPDVSKIPAEDILGVTVLLVTCSYNNEEFIRVGYYVNNEYADEELREDPPSQPRLDRVMRNILADKPRVTRFPCDFDAQAIPGMENVASEDAMMGDENQEVQQGGMGVDFSKDQAGFFQQQQAPGQTQGLW